MAPHNDAPSPPGLYSAGFNTNGSAPRPVGPSALRLGDFTPTESPLSSSFGSSSLGNSAGMHLTRPLLPGVYVPTMCFFDPKTEDVDEAMIAEHAVRLAKAGVTGLATQGSNGEAVHLTHEERRLVTSTTRKALDGAGYSDMPLVSLAAGGHGILAGLANIAPRACVRTIELYREGKLAEAQAMQEVLSRGDWTAIQGGVVGVKSGLQSLMGYGGYARSPLPRPTPEQAKKWREGFEELYALEKSL
ncbi:hypothetical protein MAPG_05849 [Magnaporthiopsis poae ATCC 64411]|uniref:Dihydrodipicolinate synthase n=1 Tax=Magnaporthiopsis poae (strain ATCC 64411 / 73-15) TaxID=644358 RepID=A0A0C4E0H6_MAGP6|nr:hypothetical protein MAPG_05849 [Magnaporthiopsis poae ATCC 64411]